ncbi:hypothetical protein [Deinococcus aquiradiocola]|uniref:Uncharacterized protein n=1 Tax=Deinococcus aquiradiocola TaxID=393059 RepID=A0A917PQ71_9DEIO|nr:hypothetical protein [Deinococcus aquiradiocola]GGJ86862.1 hypothetical protein GCM10008939_33540 [Deinococcus aquiradiocola]
MNDQPHHQGKSTFTARVITVDPATTHITQNLLYGNAFTTARSTAHELQPRSLKRKSLDLEADVAAITADQLSEPRGHRGARVDYAHDHTLRTDSQHFVRDAAVMRWLENEAFNLQTARRFHFGLKSGQNYSRALIFPLIDASGQPRTRRIYHGLPGITRFTGPPRNTWTLGPPTTYWATPIQQQPIVIICHGFTMTWRFAQFIAGTSLAQQVCLITSSNPDTLPEEWTDPNFWATWQEIYFACDNEVQAELLTEAHASIGMASRQLHLLLPPTGQTWRGFMALGGTDELLVKQLQTAGLPLTEESEPAPPLEEVPTNALLDVNMTFSNGALHYPFYRYRAASPTMSLMESEVPLPTIERCVLRSDGKVLRVVPLPARPMDGGPTLMLDDGSLIEDLPATPASVVTFSHKAIEAFQTGQINRRPAGSRTGRELLDAVRQALSTSVPELQQEESLILAYTLFLSYVQAIFPVLPVVRVDLPHVQDRLAMELHALGCNAVELPVQVGLDVLTSALHSSGGLVIVRGDEQGEAPLTVDLIQVLRRACLRQTAISPVLDAGSGSLRLISTKALTVLFHPSSLPADGAAELVISDSVRGKAKPGPVQASAAERFRLRQDLHIWGMEQAVRLSTTDVDKAYPAMWTDPRIKAIIAVALVVGDHKSTDLLVSQLALRGFARLKGKKS